MIYSLRQAAEDDYDFLYGLHGRTIRVSVEAMWGWDEAEQARRFRDKWDTASIQVVVVEGKDVGTLKLEERNGDCFIALIEIDPGYQGRGLGSAIIGDVVSAAHRRGQTVALNVLKTNPQAHRLYARLGFQVSEEQVDRYVMRLPVSGGDP